MRAYWNPVYKRVRLRFCRNADEAADLTQSFFVRAYEKEFFAPWDPGKGRFRTFLKVCLDGFVSNETRAASALKRGGDFVFTPLEFERAEGEIAEIPLPAREDTERLFEADWARSVFEMAVERLGEDLRARGRADALELFERYDLAEGGASEAGYRELGAALGMSETAVTNALALARREFRRIVLEIVRDLTATDEEFRQEMRALTGRDPS